MRFALLSDIHANLPALQAVLADIERRKIEKIYCLGDLVNFAGWDNEVIDTIRSKRIICVQGNHDEGIGYEKDLFPFSYHTAEEYEFGKLSIRWVNTVITGANRQFLQELPFSIEEEFHFPGGKMRMMLVHGSPVSNNDYIMPDTDLSKLNEWLDKTRSDILIVGHTHLPYWKKIPDKRGSGKVFRHIINPGSVGKPKHGDNNACYCELSFRETAHAVDPGAILADIRFVKYDTDSVIKKIKESDLPATYERFLRNGQQLFFE